MDVTKLKTVYIQNLETLANLPANTKMWVDKETGKMHYDYRWVQWARRWRTGDSKVDLFEPLKQIYQQVKKDLEGGIWDASVCYTNAIENAYPALKQTYPNFEELFAKMKENYDEIANIKDPYHYLYADIDWENAWVCGGHALRCFSDGNWKVGDLDVFHVGLTNEEFAQRVQKFRAKYPGTVTKNQTKKIVDLSVPYHDNNGKTKYLIVSFIQSPADVDIKDVLDSFDLDICRIGFKPKEDCVGYEYIKSARFNQQAAFKETTAMQTTFLMPSSKRHTKIRQRQLKYTSRGFKVHLVHDETCVKHIKPSLIKWWGYYIKSLDQTKAKAKTRVVLRPRKVLKKKKSCKKY